LIYLKIGGNTVHRRSLTIAQNHVKMWAWMWD